jgi:hypothetical protein
MLAVVGELNTATYPTQTCVIPILGWLFFTGARVALVAPKASRRSGNFDHQLGRPWSNR